jgi:hypothetical protein
LKTLLSKERVNMLFPSSHFLELNLGQDMKTFGTAVLIIEGSLEKTLS